MSFDAFQENIILANISGFTVSSARGVGSESALCSMKICIVMLIKIWVVFTIKRWKFLVFI